MFGTKAKRKQDRKQYDGKETPGAVGFTSGFSQIKIAMVENFYCWAIDRTSNNHDDIQAMIYI